MKIRTGVSLMELLLTMSACTVILTMSTALVHRMMHAQSKMRVFVDTERTSLRLSAMFRDDVHRAEKVVDAKADAEDGSGAAHLLVLRFSDERTVEYRHDNGTLERRILAGDMVQSREMFRFPVGAKFVIEQQDPNVVVLSITATAEDVKEGTDAKAAETDSKPQSLAWFQPVSVRIAAVLGRDPATVAAPAREERDP